MGKLEAQRMPELRPDVESFSELAERLKSKGDAVCDEAVAALEKVIADRNAEFQRAEEWRAISERYLAERKMEEEERQKEKKAVIQVWQSEVRSIRQKYQVKIKNLEHDVRVAENRGRGSRSPELSAERFAEQAELFEFHLKHISETNLQLERQLDACQVELLDALLALHLNGKG